MFCKGHLMDVSLSCAHYDAVCVWLCENKEDLPWGISGSLAGGIRNLDRVKQCIKSFHTNDPVKNETSEHLLHSAIHLRHQITGS